MSTSKFTRGNDGRTRRRRGRNGPRFAQVFHFVINTHRWRSLSGIAVKAYVVITGKLYDGINNGRLMASARWLANEIGVSPDTASRALKELQAGGFLECRVRRGFNNKRMASEYRLTVYPCDVTGRAPTWTPNSGPPEQSQQLEAA